LLLHQERKEEELRLQMEALAHEQERKRQAQDAYRRQEDRIKAEIAEKEEAEAQALLAAQAARKGGKKNLKKVLKRYVGLNSLVLKYGLKRWNAEDWQLRGL
jgi:hypothetical protein